MAHGEPLRQCLVDGLEHHGLSAGGTGPLSRGTLRNRWPGPTTWRGSLPIRSGMCAVLANVCKQLFSTYPLIVI